MRSAFQQFPREDADTGSDFDNMIAELNVCCIHNASEHALINEEMLTHFPGEADVVSPEEAADFLSKGHRIEESIAILL